MRGDPVGVLFQQVHMAAGDDPCQLLVRQGAAQCPLQRVLLDVQRCLLRGKVDPLDRLRAAPGAPGAPAQSGQCGQDGGGVRTQQQAGAGRAGRRDAVGGVQYQGGDGVPGEGEGQGEAGGTRPDDDHRVHGAETSLPWWC